MFSKPPIRNLAVPNRLEMAADYTALTSTNSKNRLLEAVRFAHGLWRLQAHFQNIIINGPIALGPPGCLAGPVLDPLIRTAPDVATDQGTAAEFRDAVARGVSTCFGMWQSGVQVPGLAWYPQFAAFPGPMAPPVPNIPAPLLACPSATASQLSQPLLKQAIVTQLPQAMRVPQVETAVGAMAQSLATYFSTWIVTQIVMNVMGQGPVPSFAPPYVPVGPVVAGSVIPTPGHLVTGSQPPMIVV